MLWIAFRSLYLWYSKQQTWRRRKLIFCCELLSKVYIFDIRNNNREKFPIWEWVVNCFQKFISLIFETTWHLYTWNRWALWIAFKSLYLWYSKQHVRKKPVLVKGCELLSKVYIFDIRNNVSLQQKAKSMSCELLSKVYIFDIRNNVVTGKVRFSYVVNCFQKFISLIFETTLTMDTESDD